MGRSGVDWDGKGEGRGLKNGGWDDVKLGLGDCVWCVLLPKPVAIATTSSRTTPPVSYN